MEKTRLTVGRHTVSLFSPVNCMGCPVAYISVGEKDAETIAALLDDTEFVLVAVDGVDWEGELSPWPAPRAFRNGSNFAGLANTYLSELTGDIVPTVEMELGYLPSFRAIAGYSLAGLFAVYALYRTDIFSRAASISGSLWYDGFLDFMATNSPLLLPERVYFSLGDRESQIKNARLASVEDCTVRARKLMQNLGIDTAFEMNPGNHFTDIPERIVRGLQWMMI